MGLAELILTAIAVSLDAFSVAICKGLGMARLNWKTTFQIALAFGLFQAGMPLLGWALGSQLLWLIAPIDHWIAFGLLAFIGTNMIREALGSDEQLDRGSITSVPLGELIMLAIATSIDALTVGIAFATLEIRIVPAVTLIGITTFCFSLAGVLIGHRFGAKHHKVATIVGGSMLILIGTKVLLEHLGVLTL